MKRTAIALALWASVACSGNLPRASLVEGVRILATRADHPYAMPGETVTLQVLAVDGRSDQRAPMRVVWLPTACVNPAGDDYFACYPSMRGQFPVDTDLSGVLVAGPEWSFTIPPGAIDTANTHPGAGAAYGVAFAFVMACAGTVQYHPVDTSTHSPLSTPFRCLDGSGDPLGADDFVFAFTRVYAYATLRNENPVIDHLTIAGAPIPSSGIALDHCTAGDESHCSKSEVDTVVPDTSWELDTVSLAPEGKAAHEAIWVDYYATGGRFDDDSAVLFESIAGKVANAGDGYAPPLSAGPRTLWAVVHDTRGGASWASVPVNVR